MMKNFDFYSCIGDRAENQDSVLVKKIDEEFLFIVADGLGGHNGGARASFIATQSIYEQMKDFDNRQNIEACIKKANDDIIAQQVGKLSSMKTTIAMAYMNKDAVCFAHVGDTRIYAFKDNEIVYQSVDHSVSQMAVLLGEITLDEIRTHVDRNKLTQALGNGENVKMKVCSLLKNEFDAILICSDGFWEDVLEEEMCKTLEVSENSQQWLGLMKKYIKNKKNHDNHSAITILCGEN